MNLPLKKLGVKDFLPYGCQTIEDDDIAAVSRAMIDPLITCGPKVDEFEIELGKKIDSSYVTAVCNGTAALHLAAYVSDIQPGDQVIVPSLTFLSTANAVRFLGGEVIFCDVNEKTGLMDWPSYQNALRRVDPSRLKALFYVHLNGQVGSDFARIALDAHAHGLKVVEDGAHAIGSAYTHEGKTYKVGACAHSDAVIFSFHPVKTMTTGEGGVISVKDEKLDERLKKLRRHGVTMFTDPERVWVYEMRELGYNYRITDIQAALGLSQLQKLDRFVARRRELVAAYDQALAGLDAISLLPKAFPELTSWHLYPILLDFTKMNLSKGELVTALKERNIGSQVHYVPVHTQPYYQKLGKVDLPGAEKYYEAVLSLPLYPTLTFDDVAYVVDALKDLIRS